MSNENVLKQRLEQAEQEYLQIEQHKDWPANFAGTLIQNFCSLYGEDHLDILVPLPDEEFGDQIYFMALGVLGKLEQLLSEDLNESKKRDYSLVLAQQRHAIAFSRWLSDRGKTTVTK